MACGLMLRYLQVKEAAFEIADFMPAATLGIPVDRRAALTFDPMVRSPLAG
jgi:hypothetical protein